MISLTRRSTKSRTQICSFAFLLLCAFTITAQAAEDADDAKTEIAVEHLTDIQLLGPNLAKLEPFSDAGRHMIGRIAGGTATGPVLNGELLPVGEDWALIRPDGTLEIDVRMLLKTDDGALIHIWWNGRWKGSKDIFDRILAGEDVDESEYYLRVTPYFETKSEKYAWLNSTVAVGFGKVKRGEGVTMRIFRVE